MTEIEVKLKLFEDYERIHGLVFSEEHKQKMMDETKRKTKHDKSTTNTKQKGYFNRYKCLDVSRY